MTIQNAINKIEKSGYRVKRNGRVYFSKVGNQVIIFHEQNGNAICIQVRHQMDQDDVHTDYFAGQFVQNISQALRLAEETKNHN